MEVRLAVRVKPRSSRSRVVGMRDGVLEVTVVAPPVEGLANRELVGVLAEYFGIPRSAIDIAKGTSGRHKWVDLRGVDPERVALYLGGRSPR